MTNPANSVVTVPAAVNSNARLRRLGGEGGFLNHLSRGTLPNEDSPLSSVENLDFEISSILLGGIESLSSYWPLPNTQKIRELTLGIDPAVALGVAWEVRRIVQAADRAPNVTGLFAKKLEQHRQRGLEEMDGK